MVIATFHVGLNNTSKYRSSRAALLQQSNRPALCKVNQTCSSTTTRADRRLDFTAISKMTSSVDADCNLGLSLKIFHAPAPNFNDNHGTFCLLSQCLGCSFSAHPSHPYARCDFLADLIHATNRSAKAKFRGPGSGLIFASSHPVVRRTEAR